MPGHSKIVYATDIVAVSYTGSEIPVFEHSEAFWIYAVDETKVVRMQILSVYSGKAGWMQSSPGTLVRKL